MSQQDDPSLSADQLHALEQSLRRGSESASAALAAWLDRPSVVEIDTLEQLALEEATELLANGDCPICFCSMDVQGVIRGQLILAFDDASGFALADLLLGQPEGTSTAWTEMAVSAAMETTNIVGCAYLNSLSRGLSRQGESSALVPEPPQFRRDFAPSLLQFALMGQAITNDRVMLAKTRFTIQNVMVDWTLLFVPDAQSMHELPQRLLGRDRP